MAVRKTTTAPTGAAITVLKLDFGEATCLVRGTSPLIFNAMSAKAKHELLLPRGRKTAADKAQSLKHDPRQEFRDSVYRHADDKHPTRLKFPAPAFKCILQTAALEVPGAKKSQVGRLTWIEGTHVDIYGVPKLLMSVVRSADINRTPDIRTRAILEEWATTVTVKFTQPTLNAQTLATLLGAGGMISGLGDFRQERGSGNYGQFQLVDDRDAAFKRIQKEGGRQAQDAALEAAEPFDIESLELLGFWDQEISRRGIKAVA
jgi:hypothetical protein